MISINLNDIMISMCGVLIVISAHRKRHREDHEGDPPPKLTRNDEGRDRGVVLVLSTVYPCIITSISTGCSSSFTSSYNRLGEGCSQGRTLHVAVNASPSDEPNMLSLIPHESGEHQQQAEQRKGEESILFMFLLK